MRATKARWGHLVLFGALLCAGPAWLPGVAAASAKVPAPTVASIKVTPPSLGPAGGRVAVSGSVKHASMCQLVLVHATSLNLVYSKGPSRTCHAGSFAAHVTVGPNRGHSAVSVLFKVVAKNGKLSSSKQFTISIAAQPVPTTTTTTVPPTTTTTLPPPTGLAPLPSYLTASGEQSLDWAGYELQGGPYTAVEATFTIPTLTSSATCSQFMDEWVGVDDGSNSYILRAGINISEQNPSTGSCATGHEFLIPYVVSEPAGTLDTVPVAVSAGDSVTLLLWQTTTGNWALNFNDLTNGQRSSTTIAYSGPATSLEWMVSTPTDPTACGAGVAPDAAQGICEIPPFSPISFTNLFESGTVGALTQASLEQPSASVSVGTINSDSFSLSYSS